MKADEIAARVKTAVAEVETKRRIDALPHDRQGRPVPWSSAWSSECWGSIRHEPLVKGLALFSKGNQGRGRPVLGIMNEDRQRRAMLLAICGICGEALDGYGATGWLPITPRNERLQDGPELTTDPPMHKGCCMASLFWCPKLNEVTEIIRVAHGPHIAQLIDPSAAPTNRWQVFDRISTADIDRLGAYARKHGGVCGYIKLGLEVIEREAVA